MFQSKNESKLEELTAQIYYLLKQESGHEKLRLLESFLNAIPLSRKNLSLYFELYRFAFENGILIEGHYISPVHVSNMIHLGHVLGDNVWVANFIDNIQDYLDSRKDKGENIRCLFQAYSNYYQQKYNEAFRLINFLKLEDASYGMRQHLLLLMTLVDGRDEITYKYNFDAKCRSFNAYLNRKCRSEQISEQVRKINMDFVRLVNKVYYADFKGYKKDQLLSELAAYEGIPFRSWLLAKIGTIKN